VTDVEHPEDEQRDEAAEAAAPTTPPEAAAEESPPEAAAEEVPTESAEEPAPVEAAEEPAPVEAAEEPAPVEAAEEPAPVEAAEEPAPVEAAEEPAPVEAMPEPAPVEAAEEPAPPAEEVPAETAAEPPPAQPTAEPAAQPAADAVPAAPEDGEEVEIAPRQRPEIPGADLIPDIVPESDQFLDAEARAAAEAEAEEAAREDDHDSDQESQPIADAAIDLAAGARYTATGKRKTAVARVILKPGTGTYSINGKELDAFFPRDTLRRIIRQPLETVGYDARMDVVARMHGGGVAAQAGALRHGISRALIVADPNLRGELKRRGFLTRDPRVKERKKAGLKKARKRPQFSKR
jgi:small subunit ribosomal protein S9